VDQAHPHRIQNDVANQLEEMRLALDQYPMKPPLKHMADSIVTPIELL
jgi:hypothetical protein